MLAVTLHVSKTVAEEAFPLFGVHLPPLTRELLFPASEKTHIWKNFCSLHDEESQFHAVHQLSDGCHQDDEEEELVVWIFLYCVKRRRRRCSISKETSHVPVRLSLRRDAKTILRPSERMLKNSCTRRHSSFCPSTMHNNIAAQIKMKKRLSSRAATMLTLAKLKETDQLTQLKRTCHSLPAPFFNTKLIW